jgi:hypothetical protein
MRLFELVAGVSLLSSTTSAQWESYSYTEASTGITYSSNDLPNGLTYRIALPLAANSSDAIFQIVAPKAYGWCALAWGGHMLSNPLAVAWATEADSGPKGIASSRIAFGYYAVPRPNDAATYTLLDKATTSNTTHWTVTARCRGCTSYSSSDDGDVVVDAGDTAHFAYACSSVAPLERANNESDFSQHENPGSWESDLKRAKNADYAKWVADNGLGSALVEREWFA